MPIYRSDQTQLSFSAEAGLGGYMDFIITATTAGWTGGLINMFPGGLVAGSRSVIFDGVSGGTLSVGDYVSIGTPNTAHSEIRRISSLGTYTGGGAGTVFFDYPTGFFHADNDPIVEATVSTAPTGQSFATFFPGVWETINVPDLIPEIIPIYMGSTTALRNWSIAYRGKQSFPGSLPGLILLNGFPLRFPFGRIDTIGTPSSITTINQDILVGQRTLSMVANAAYTNGNLIQVGSGNTHEVRQIISGGVGTILTVNYPFLIPQTSGAALSIQVSPFTHTILERNDLDTMTWHLLHRDSGETTANDFITRYIGGKVNRATISADEGETVRFSIDDIQFIDLVHNQQNSSGVTGDIAKFSGSLISPSGVGGSMIHSGGALAPTSHPTTPPYYFSQGTISLFGITFGVIRNFRIEINNNLDARYYLRDTAGDRTPSAFIEQRREYKIFATVTMPDSITSTATTRTLFKELVLEGTYNTIFTTTNASIGFNISLTFTRGTNDTIVITSPVGGAASAGIGTQGCFFLRASHDIGENPIQVDGEILIRNMSIVITDSIGVYP